MFAKLDERGYPISFYEFECEGCISVDKNIYAELSSGNYAFYNNELINITNKFFDYSIKQWVDLPQEVSQQQKENRLSQFKEYMLTQLKQRFEDYANNKATMHSTTLDKDVNARRVDLINIDGLLATIGTNTVQFRCADNTFVEVDADKLKALKLELIQYGQKMYQNKWAIEQQINALTTDDIDKQYEIDLVNGQLVEK